MNSKSNIPKWQTFEKLVAALHIAEQKGATVKWNEKINGRQFDVTVRIKSGLYEFLTVIECKDYGKPIKVEKIDALATKSRDAKADKAVMVSANGYQKGAKEVAKNHNITLLTLKSLKAPKQNLENSFSPVLSLSFFRFAVIGEDCDFIALPEETGVLRSLMRSTRIVGNGFNISPEDMIRQHQRDITEHATSTPQSYAICFTEDAEMIHPNTLERTKVKSLIFDYVLITESDLGDDFGYSDDPYLSDDVYQLRDELKEDEKFVDFSKINLGFDTVLEVGKFYKNPKLNFYYYCEIVNSDDAIMCVVESYQHNTLIQVTFIQKLSLSSQFVEVVDEQEITRLRSMYNEYKIATANNTEPMWINKNL